ncbi:hypothetical protein [Corynebacterium mastitidis]
MKRKLISIPAFAAVGAAIYCLMALFNIDISSTVGSTASVEDIHFSWKQLVIYTLGGAAVGAIPTPSQRERKRQSGRSGRRQLDDEPGGGRGVH